MKTWSIVSLFPQPFLHNPSLIPFRLSESPSILQNLKRDLKKKLKAKKNKIKNKKKEKDYLLLIILMKLNVF